MISNQLIAAACICLLLCTACSVFKKSAAPITPPEMVFVPGGIFKMGDIAGTGNSDALPLHRVTINDFYIGKYEVTVSQFNAYVRRTNKKGASKDSAQTAKRPIVQITWDEAQAYCGYFGYRLPTEAEWEYAARAGGKAQRFAGTASQDSLFRYAHVDNNEVSRPLPVGLKKPNDLGLYDMSGNVFEWVGRYYQRYPQEGNSPDWDDLDERILRIIRGGSYTQIAAVASTYWRAGMVHSSRASDVGFRCAADEDK